MRKMFQIEIQYVSAQSTAIESLKQHFCSHSKVLPTNHKGQTGAWQHSWRKEEMGKVTSTELKGVLSLYTAEVASGTEARRGIQA